MSKMDVPYKIYLEESEIPSAWYNVRADMKNKPAPLIHPGTKQPLSFNQCLLLTYVELKDASGTSRHRLFFFFSGNKYRISQFHMAL